MTHHLATYLLLPLLWLALGVIGLFVLVKGGRTGTLRLKLGVAEMLVAVGPPTENAGSQIEPPQGSLVNNKGVQ